MSDHLSLDELYHSENSKENYIDVIMGDDFFEPNDNVISLSLKIDRGVTDFDLLSEVLSIKFPKLRKLKIDQNYSFGDNTHATNFLNFLQSLNLEEFILDDFQSSFLNQITIDNIFSVMPDKSTCIIITGNSNDDSIIKSGKYIKSLQNKTIIWTSDRDIVLNL